IARGLDDLALAGCAAQKELRLAVSALSGQRKAKLHLWWRRDHDRKTAADAGTPFMVIAHSQRNIKSAVGCRRSADGPGERVQRQPAWQCDDGNVPIINWNAFRKGTYEGE